MSKPVMRQILATPKAKEPRKEEAVKVKVKVTKKSKK